MPNKAQEKQENSTSYHNQNQEGNTSRQDQNHQQQLSLGMISSSNNNDSRVKNPQPIDPNSQQHQQLLGHRSEEKARKQHPQGAIGSEAQQPSGVVPPNTSSFKHNYQLRSNQSFNNSDQHKSPLPVSPPATSNNPTSQPPQVIHIQVTIDCKLPVEDTPPENARHQPLEKQQAVKSLVVDLPLQKREQAANNLERHKPLQKQGQAAESLMPLQKQEADNNVEKHQTHQKQAQAVERLTTEKQVKAANDQERYLPPQNQAEVAESVEKNIPPRRQEFKSPPPKSGGCCCFL